MNKLKELWAKNKVLIVLLFILFVCFIAIVVVCITFFFGGSKSVYGDRLEKQEEHEVSTSFQNEYISFLESDALVDKVTFRIKGRVIYVNIVFALDTTLVEAQSKATASLEKFDENILSYYDINFTLKCASSDNSEGYTIMGAKNVNGSQSIIWNNNTKVESDEN